MVHPSNFFLVWAGLDQLPKAIFTTLADAVECVEKRFPAHAVITKVPYGGDPRQMVYVPPHAWGPAAV
jgi:hypothetical protein